VDLDREIRSFSQQWIKEGKGAIKWTRLSCRTFAANAARLQLHALAYNLGNFMRTLAMPKTAEPWSLTSLREKLIKIGAKVVSHGRYVTFQMAEVAVPQQMFGDILTLIASCSAPLQAAADRLVLGGLSDGHALQWHLGSATAASARFLLLQDGVADLRQAALQHARPGPQPASRPRRG
jgi:hypothetical protein